MKSFEANKFGLHDVVGNVWEWTSSLRKPYPYQHDDRRESPPSENGGEGARVVRGGSWYYNPRYLRVSNRNFYSPGDRVDYIGFRCARDVSP